MLARLYMFERRFQAIVREARQIRRRTRREPRRGGETKKHELQIPRPGQHREEEYRPEEDDRQAFDLMVEKAMRYPLSTEHSPEGQDADEQHNVIGFDARHVVSSHSDERAEDSSEANRANRSYSDNSVGERIWADLESGPSDHDHNRHELEPGKKLNSDGPYQFLEP